ncbi:MAG: FadR family transcriptional regulator [Deltaproteobacteria bacterium]|nr:FadR family transcriptional regulator [Deltaproteobacteria bacterium]
MLVRLKEEKRLFERIVDQIKDDVLSGALKVGDKLPSEHEMARIFGVSRTAVREALRILELSGLVIIKKGNQGGCFIQHASTGQRLVDYLSDHWRVGNITLAHLTEARSWIESIIIDMVAKKATKKDFQRLRTSIEKAEQYYREGKERDKINQNFNFHLELARITGNPLLIDALSAIFDLLSYMLVKIKPNPRITLGTFKAHRETIEFLETEQVDAARKVNMRHIREVGARLTKKYAKEKGVPQPELHTKPFPEGRS